MTKFLQNSHFFLDRNKNFVRKVKKKIRKKSSVKKGIFGSAAFDPRQIAVMPLTIKWGKVG